MSSLIMTTFRRRALLAAVLVLAACQSSKLSIRRTRDSQELSSYKLQSLTGIRDGDKLLSEAVIGDNTGTLTMQMKFQIGVPTRLETGNYVWQKKDLPQTQGVIRASSVIFLGGQNGPMSLGGSFQLIANDLPLYDVKMPATNVALPGKKPTQQ
jgi:hypothetical protein